MLHAIADFFSGLFDTIGALINFVIDTISGLIKLFTLIPQVLSYTPLFTGWLPVTCVALVSLAITIAVIKMIVGRDG